MRKKLFLPLALVSILLALLLRMTTAKASPRETVKTAEAENSVDELIEALLSESLRLNLVQACDGERVALHCPRNTEVEVLNVFYGRLVPSTDLCPGPELTHGTTTTTKTIETNRDFQRKINLKQFSSSMKKKTRKVDGNGNSPYHTEATTMLPFSSVSGATTTLGQNLSESQKKDSSIFSFSSNKNGSQKAAYGGSAPDLRRRKQLEDRLRTVDEYSDDDHFEGDEFIEDGEEDGDEDERVEDDGDHQSENGDEDEEGPSETEFPREDTTCDYVDAQKKLSELCRGRRKCRIEVRPEFFFNDDGGRTKDPCPGTGKYLQVSYRCRPTSFEDQAFCEGSTTQLGCRTGRRLAIHSARWGRLASGQTLQCATSKQHAPVEKDCLADVRPQVMAQCHGKLECSFPVNDQFLGDPCPGAPSDAAPKQLSLIYACVNDEVFGDVAIQGQLEAGKRLQQFVEEKAIRRHAESLERRRQQQQQREYTLKQQQQTRQLEKSSDTIFHHKSEHLLTIDSERREEGVEFLRHQISLPGTKEDSLFVFPTLDKNFNSPKALFEDDRQTNTTIGNTGKEEEEKVVPFGEQLRNFFAQISATIQSIGVVLVGIFVLSVCIVWLFWRHCFHRLHRSNAGSSSRNSKKKNYYQQQEQSCWLDSSCEFSSLSIKKGKKPPKIRDKEYPDPTEHRAFLRRHFHQNSGFRNAFPAPPKYSGRSSSEVAQLHHSGSSSARISGGSLPCSNSNRDSSGERNVDFEANNERRLPPTLLSSDVTALGSNRSGKTTKSNSTSPMYLDSSSGDSTSSTGAQLTVSKSVTDRETLTATSDLYCYHGSKTPCFGGGVGGDSSYGTYREPRNFFGCGRNNPLALYDSAGLRNHSYLKESQSGIYEVSLASRLLPGMISSRVPPLGGELRAFGAAGSYSQGTFRRAPINQSNKSVSGIYFQPQQQNLKLPSRQQRQPPPGCSESQLLNTPGRTYRAPSSLHFYG